MAKYRVKGNSNGTFTIQARYRPFKRGGLRLKEITVARAGAGEAAQELAEWVKSQRHPKGTG